MLSHKENAVLKKIAAVRFIGVLIMLFVMPPSSWAGTSTGVITSITVSNFNNTVTFLAGAHINKPACANATNDNWSFSLSDANAKTMYALLLSAAAQGKTITVVGYSCDSATTSEYPTVINVNF